MKVLDSQTYNEEAALMRCAAIAKDALSHSYSVSGVYDVDHLGEDDWREINRVYMLNKPAYLICEDISECMADLTSSEAQFIMLRLFDEIDGGERLVKLLVEYHEEYLVDHMQRLLDEDVAGVQHG
jgi:hypothetical protein